ncbi:MAG TPA: serine-type D-Ala-D-Ala carboxypeptidase, partial [Oceanospirillales bacterium]|nr:serine-type D-Ala-D-Ala carboxypeptidase [Oceanospirillales bacterium]
ALAKRVSIEVYKGEEEQLNLGLEHDLYVTIPKGKYKNLSAKADVPEYLIAPIANKQAIGKLNVQLNNKIIVSKNLVALKAIAAGSWWTRTVDSMALWFK